MNALLAENADASKEMDCYTEDKKKQLASKHRELSKAKRRSELRKSTL